MKCYKGFDKNLACRGFKYEAGKEYETETAEICESGFHACENPFDVFNYYPPSDSRFCEVDLDANDQRGDDSKRVGKHIRIEAEIGLLGLIAAGVKFILDKVDWNNAKESNTGDSITELSNSLHNSSVRIFSPLRHEDNSNNTITPKHATITFCLIFASFISAYPINNFRYTHDHTFFTEGKNTNFHSHFFQPALNKVHELL